MDLIWGRPGHDVAAWRAELREALAIADGHLSLYHLALEKGTRLERQHRARPADFPATGEVDAMMAATVEETAEAGYVQYEASSFARPSHESRHNSAYWRGLDYVGVGPGAHGRCFSIARPGERERRVQIALPEAWMAATEAGQDGCAKATPLSRSEMAEELVMLGMQLREGVDAARFLLYTGTPLVEFIDRAAAEQLQQDGFVKLDDRGLRPTARGMSLIDSLVPRLLLTN